jgi:hypothetical protein
MRDVMQSFHNIEETLSLTMKYQETNLFEKILAKPMGKIKENADHTACLKYLEISAGLGDSNEHPQW